MPDLKNQEWCSACHIRTHTHSYPVNDTYTHSHPLHMHMHTHSNIRTLLTHKGRSASMALLHDLHSRGWTVVDLASLARRAQMAVIVDKIKQHCQGI